jgi:hypothetical protein
VGVSSDLLAKRKSRYDCEHTIVAGAQIYGMQFCPNLPRVAGYIGSKVLVHDVVLLARDVVLVNTGRIRDCCTHDLTVDFGQFRVFAFRAKGLKKRYVEGRHFHLPIRLC